MLADLPRKFGADSSVNRTQLRQRHDRLQARFTTTRPAAPNAGARRRPAPPTRDEREEREGGYSPDSQVWCAIPLHVRAADVGELTSDVQSSSTTDRGPVPRPASARSAADRRVAQNLRHHLSVGMNATA